MTNANVAEGLRDYTAGLNAILHNISERQRWWDNKGRHGLEPKPVDMHMDACALTSLVRHLEHEADASADLLDSLQRERDFQTGVHKVAVDRQAVMQREIQTLRNQCVALLERAEDAERNAYEWKSTYDTFFARMERLITKDAAERDEANKRADEAVAQQAAMAEALNNLRFEGGIDLRLKIIAKTLSSLSPRAKQLLAVVAANAKWQSSRRASPMDHAGELAGFIALKRELDALYTEGQ